MIFYGTLVSTRYKDERVYAIGHGVAVDWAKNKQGDLEIFSDFMPVVEVPQVTADTSNGSSKALSFEFLTEIEPTERSKKKQSRNAA